ncbi:ADP-ribosylation factor GTPase-activating protein 1 [Nematocida parisii]|nr:ADP-ribosylation factor GTPase-activating protein 1 [Nematocida parisii]KAI5130697.1 ADP-ribosylation factor GTPase-activating protein 1 [Nematocida parisii]KAI5144487.1 ADP-ribosylation factor GTPase-activating protein 1 [Nematocida parisii]KAI5145131.1 ADP-ribosylation factor GTPase-activating protein 1 [Nematocida parisii]KAI5155071.1 ADP-ribosylation factor GTPase-activating protein 1 [Nematocida parisii]
MPSGTETMSLKEIIASTDENKKCVDCNMTRPQWASITYGVFLCLNCAGVHRSYGVKVSMVKSLSMDMWNDSEKKTMELGGNKRFLEYVEESQLESLSKEELYTSKKMAKYAAELKKSVRKIFPEAAASNMPSPKERRKKPQSTPSPPVVDVHSAKHTASSSTESTQSSYINMYNQASFMAMPALENVQSGITDMLGRAAEYFSYATSTLSGHISEKVLTPASSIIKEKGEQLSEYIKGKETNRHTQDKDTSKETKKSSQEKPSKPGHSKPSFDKWD